ncbi:MAG: MoaD/ThiS family protein [Planctomycetes bacterium]|nr:MoaD/ThiS family protein [Planctomycetota bacterium]
MPRIRTTPHLNRYFPALSAGPVEVQARLSVADLIRELDRRFPGLAAYLVDDRGALRQHVVVFVDNRPIDDRVGLSDEVDESADVFIAQALSGG